MSRKWLLVSLCLFGLLAGCTQQLLEPKEAATLFVERVIFQQQEQAFADSFVDGEAIGAQSDEFDEVLLQDLAMAFSGTGGALTTAQIETLSDNLMRQMKIKTTYQVKEIIEVGERATVIYEVKGLDFVSIVRDTTKELSERMITDLEIAQNDQKIAATVTEILETRIEAVQLITETTEIPIVLRIDNNKWVISDDQQEAVINLMLAFATGARDQQSLNQAISETNQLALEEFMQAE